MERHRGFATKVKTPAKAAKDTTTGRTTARATRSYYYKHNCKDTTTGPFCVVTLTIGP